jgi:hypothetical protein
LSEIYYNAFEDSPIEEFVVDDENETLSSVDGIIFSKDKTYLKTCPVGKSGAYTIPNTVTTIDDFAFRRCYKLTSIEIPDSVTTIKGHAFGQCSGLTSIVIPDSVTSIGKSAFYSCSGLTSIVLSNSLTSIDEEAFDGCSSLTSIVIPDSVTSIGRYAFYSCYNLTSVTIGIGLTSVNEYAFYGCTNLEVITINMQAAPTYCFGTGSSTAGYNKRTTGTNRLYVPANATGYESGDWVNYLCNSNYGGFTLSKTL